MVTFQFKSGLPAMSTMTVGELIEELKSYERDMPVLATWEGQLQALDAQFFAVDKVGENDTDALVIDVEWT